MFRDFAKATEEIFCLVFSWRNLHRVALHIYPAAAAAAAAECLEPANDVARLGLGYSVL